jgi:adenine-specific DNA-methyltransferase
MKYMGSKRSMLKNGLGDLLIEQCSNANRIFDPFCGSSSVVWFLAEKCNKQIIAGDLQKYSTDLANAVILRDSNLTVEDLQILTDWLNQSKSFHEIVKVDLDFKSTIKCVKENRTVSKKSHYNLASAYGGHYFSLDQALKLDSLLIWMPEIEPLRSVASAALIQTASLCVASPGHTAQPFQPKGNGLGAIMEAWSRNPFSYVEKSINDIANRHAKKIGMAITTDASSLIDTLEKDDIVFLDPPYSEVHYSRFYHVLETISRNKWINVSGTGRYPSGSLRPKSEYSYRSKSENAVDSLFLKISQKKSRAIVTFPEYTSSNGLSGKMVYEMAKKYFKVKKDKISGYFSTMGGNNEHRPPRHISSELILLLNQK